MKFIDINKILLFSVFLVVLSFSAFAAGGGGGGSYSSGLGFGSRDSILIQVNSDYSQKFSLKNGTKYYLKIHAEDSKATVNFGNVEIELKNGDNYVDLNGNGLADIDFNLVSADKTRANVRILNSKDIITITQEDNNAITTEKNTSIEEKEKTNEESENGLKCGNLNDLKDRVSCRIDLEEDEQEEELKLYYLPEECRALNGSSRGLCVASYKSVQTCWKFPVGNERISCVKRAIKLEDLQKEKELCNKKAGNERSDCVRDFKDKGYKLIKWHFYDFEERAEDLMQRNLIDKDSAVDFISKTEQNKIDFNNAKTKEERKDIILAVKQDWKEFADKVRENLKD